MRLRVGLWLVLAALLVAVGDANAAAPTRASWAAAANKRCAVAYAAIRRLPKLTTATIVPDLRATLRIGKALTTQLAAIPAPANERATVRRLIAISRGEIVLLQQYLAAIDAGDQAAVKRLAAKIANDRSGDRFNAFARSLGARVCAENPEPQG